ncbi:MAG: hypothetical protein JOZ37_16035 [Actinobacteria bacterium]|nr:hypothetical protein [Actinomycetota bacterium]MBV9932812.1 hypothetical protein [Actinomycetota bacterium]
MPDATLSPAPPQMPGRRHRFSGVGAAFAGFGVLTLVLVAAAGAAAHALVPHAYQPIAHKLLGAQPLTGLASLLFALGAPLRWTVGAAGTAQHVTGTLRAGDLAHAHPLVLLGPVVVAIAVLATGWLTARHATRTGNSAAGAAAGVVGTFAALSALAAMAVSRTGVSFGADMHARVHVDAAGAFFLAGAWAALGAAAGWALAVRRVPHVADAIASWRTRVIGPVSGAVVSGVLLTALVSPQAATSLAATKGTTSTTSGPSTTVAPDASTSSTAPADTSTTAAAAGHTTTTGHTSTTRGTTSTTGRTTTVAAGKPAASTPGAPHVEALALQPPTPGTYTYTTSGSAAWGLGKTVFPSTSTLTVDPAVNGRQHSRRQILTVAGEGFVIDQWLEYGVTGIRVGGQMITTTFNHSTAIRDLKTPTTQLYLSPTPTPGEHHEFDLASPVVSAHEVVDVLRTETVSVGGQNVSAAVVRTVMHLGGTATGTLEFDQWFDMSRRIVVKETSTATVKASIVTLNSNYSATLQRLTPS